MSDSRPIVLVDVMDTLVREPYWTDLPRFFGMTPQQLRAAQHPTAWIDFEAGRLDEAEYLASFFSDGRPVDGAALRAFLHDHFRWMDGAEAWLAELAAGGCAIHALSNYPVWYELIEDKLQLSRYLRWTFVSCHTGVRKPDPRAFSGAVDSLGVAAADCLFIDDRASNVDAARRLGLPSLLYEGAGNLRSDLLARQLLPT